MLRQFAFALSFLTIIPVPSSAFQNLTPQDLARSFSFFPIVGLILGALTTGLLIILKPCMPHLLLAVSLAATLVILTRALHLDGLADLADGLGGGFTPERRLEIMKDSRTGPFGALALILALLFKVAALDTLLLSGTTAPILLVPVISRLAIPLTAYKSHYPRPQGGLNKPFLAHTTQREILLATLTTVIIAFLAAPKLIPYYACVLALVVLLLRAITRKALGGVTGDVLGAANELSELALFTVSACLAS